MQRTLILASGSPRRRELLLQVGIVPRIIPSKADERTEERKPEQVVMELSKRKAAEVANRLRTEKNDGEKPENEENQEECVILGSDTVVAVDGRILGKPGSRQEAVEMLRLLQGRTHQVFTGVTLLFCERGEQVTFAEKTDVELYPMEEEQIGRYVDTGDSMDKAGAYGIQGCFAAYVKGVRGDYNSVVGLPVGRVCQELAKYGWY